MGYADWLKERLRTLKSIIRDDPILNNYQFKSFEIVGTMRIPETVGMPAIRIIPDEDDIRQVETQTRLHGVRIDLFIFNHIPYKGEEAYMRHVELVGRVYDVVMENRQLNCLARDAAPRSVKTVGAFSETANATTFISRIRLTVESDKDE